MAEAWLGIDVGTQGARAVLIDGSGGVLGQGSRPLTSVRAPGRHEQDPRDWTDAVAGACRQALYGAPGYRVAALAVCATSGTITVVDGRGRPLAPGLMYDDVRAGAQAEAANRAGAELWSRLGYRVQPSWALPKLLWLLAQRPALPPDARLRHQSDVVTGWLAGNPVATDWSHALKSGYDLLELRWPAELLDALGVPQPLLPDVVAPGQVIGTVGVAAAAETGLPPGTPIVAGMTDGCASQLAAGVVAAGSWNCVLGTTLVFKGVTPALVRDPEGAVYSHRAADGSWLPGGASSVGAGYLAHAFGDADHERLDALARSVESTAPVLYPLVGRGERFPFVAPQAESFALGEISGTAEHYAAALQGVAFIERLGFDYLSHLGMPVDTVTLTGGGSASRYWCQVQADVLGRPVSVTRHADAAFGMAVLASRRDSRQAGELARTAAKPVVIEPRAHAAGAYTGRYLELVDELTRRAWLPETIAETARERFTS
ncbi:FGGY-family carbohydrate kinase [Rugosimonospora africana]|uniref:Carbohydrate kinase n=1 Tax=Rugosimonospora africana TaxID=556532 RepID=A0A8J3QU83_9ACTN|nr:FGGY family carbohydrate kinase [Rugosimonospora africana]GIH15788.1 carbohydrate kinase [Rugosimonospora africana]